MSFYDDIFELARYKAKNHERIHNTKIIQYKKNTISITDDNPNAYRASSIIIYNNTSWATLYVESNGYDATSTDWFPIWYQGSISIEEGDLSDISLLGSINTDVRILIT